MIFGLFTGGSKKASEKLRAQLEEARTEQRRSFDDIRGFLQPQLSRGNRASSLEADLLGINGSARQAAAFQNFRDSPGVGFLRDQGQASLDQSAASRGGLFSGRTLTDASKFNQGLAEQSITDRLNRLSSVGVRGDQARGALSQARQSLGNNLSNLFVQTGQASAAGRIGAQNERVGLLNSGLQLAAAFAGGGMGGPLGAAAGGAGAGGGGGPLNLASIGNGPQSVLSGGGGGNFDTRRIF